MRWIQGAAVGEPG